MTILTRNRENIREIELETLNLVRFQVQHSQRKDLIKWYCILTLYVLQTFFLLKGIHVAH